MENTQETIKMIEKIKKNINIHLARNDLQPEYLQDIAEYIERKEYEMLRHYNSVDVYKRDIVFKGFNNAVNSYGKCKLNTQFNIAIITIAKTLLAPNNADAIIETIAHETLHALLPFEEAHGTIFKFASLKIYEKLKLDINKPYYPSAKEIPYKYELYCPHCKMVYARKYRKVGIMKEPELYNCIKCKTQLAIRKL